MAFIVHETYWGEGDDKYTDLVCISKEERASFILYWYLNRPHIKVIRNLYVSEEYRRQSKATVIITTLQRLCDSENWDLMLWVKDESWMHQWYIKLGFKDHTGLDAQGNVWMIYKPLKEGKSHDSAI